MATYQAKKPQSVHPETPALEDDIRLRAYQLYEERGRQDGHELDDWLRAEEEITKQKTRIVAA